MDDIYFVVSDYLNEEQEHDIIRYLDENQYPWLHYTPSIWLIVGHVIDDPTSIRQMFRDICPRGIFFVQRFGMSGWAATVPKSQSTRVKRWLDRYYYKRDTPPY